MACGIQRIHSPIPGTRRVPVYYYLALTTMRRLSAKYRGGWTFLGIDLNGIYAVDMEWVSLNNRSCPEYRKVGIIPVVIIIIVIFSEILKI